LRNGDIQALVVQNPVRMGYLGVKAAVDHLQGRPPAAVVDTGVHLVTKENMATPEMSELLHPPLDQYLK
jgi:ribose transport system substrate-binding protein